MNAKRRLGFWSFARMGSEGPEPSQATMRVARNWWRAPGPWRREERIKRPPRHRL